MAFDLLRRNIMPARQAGPTGGRAWRRMERGAPPGAACYRASLPPAEVTVRLALAAMLWTLLAVPAPHAAAKKADVASLRFAWPENGESNVTSTKAKKPGQGRRDAGPRRVPVPGGAV